MNVREGHQRDNGKKILELSRELRAMPEYRLEQRISMLDWSLYVLARNYRDLRLLLDFCSNPEKSMPLWFEHNRDKLDAVQMEIARLLHNYVAAAMTLVDHTRRLSRHLAQEDCQVAGYQERVDKDFATNPAAKFIEGLRNFCLHYDVPPIKSVFHLTAASAHLDTGVRLPTGALKKWTEWTKLGRQYLDSQAEDIDLTQVVESYHGKVTDFHLWFRTNLKTSLKDKLKRVYEKKRQLADLIVPDRVEIALTEIATQRADPNLAFAALLTPPQRAVLEAIPVQSPEYWAKLISFLEEWATLQPTLKNRIRSALYSCRKGEPS